MMAEKQIQRTAYTHADSYVTKDGSIIRELMHPAVHGNSYLSLAEARVPPGSSTILHMHGVTEEVYHIISGSGFMILGEDKFEIGNGDTICISPGTAHKVENFSGAELVILCCCVPAYSHEDTYLLENIFS